MKEPNILFICSDEHTRHALGCYGAPFVTSPNLDRLAALGTRFSAAYTNSPLCVPARGSLVAGQYVHRTRCWDNGHPWHGRPEGWPHALRKRGYHIVSIGKNHFRSTADDNGFDLELLPMHVRDGVGDLLGMLRKGAVPYPVVRTAGGEGRAPAQGIAAGPAIMADAAGAGETNHTRYDRRITAAACDWLRQRKGGRSPWALHVSFVAPHFPLVAPGEFYSLYPHDRIPKPEQYAPSERPSHPVVRALARVWNFDDFFDSEEQVLRARAGYYGLVSFLDSNIGRLLTALDESGERDATFVVYTSDHGEMLGNKGIWSTSALYEDSVGIPLVVAGPGVAKGAVVDVPVSHVDVLPTLLQVSGGTSTWPGPGRSLLEIGSAQSRRTVMSEYHGGGAITGCFMLRRGRWKYHHYVGYAPELFDIEADPSESRDLGADPAHAETRTQCESALRDIVDPELVTARAFADQAATIESHGGIEAVRRRGHPGEHALDRRLGYE